MEVYPLNSRTRSNGGRGGRARPVAVTLVAMLALSLPSVALAQEVTDSPAPSVAPGGDSGAIDFPVMLGGQLLTTETFSGSEWVARFSEGESADAAYVEGTQALVESVGKSIDDLSVKTASFEPSPGQRATVAAFRVDGADARDFAEEAVDLLLGDISAPQLVMRPFGSKWTLRVVDAEMPGVYPRTVYLKDDTAWIIEGDEEYVWDALDQLPAPSPAGALPGDALLTEVPYTLDGRRRIGLYESTEPLFLPTLSERLGPELDGWLLDLYLRAGVSPSEILGVIAWWGLESNQDGIQIEGYRLPQDAAEQLEQLRSEIVLGEGAESASFTALLEGVGRSEQELGGRTVTTLDFGDSRQHVFSGVDTVWIVTDHVGEPELAEEAIASLP
jgi:hypothetical protein